MILMCDLQMRWHQLSLLLSTGYGGILQPILVGWFIYFGFGMACWYDSVGRFCLERGFSLLFSFCSLSVSVNLTWLFLFSLFLLLFFSHSLFLSTLPFPLSHFIQRNSELTAASDMLAAIYLPTPFYSFIFPSFFFVVGSSVRFCYVLVSLHWSVPRQQNPHGTGWI